MEWWKEGNVLFNDTQHILFTVIWNDGRKEMFYSTTQSTHFYLRLYGMMEGRKCFIQRHTQHIFIYGYMEWWKEGNVLFNDSQHILFTVIWNDGRKEMFYSTTQSTHFIYGYMEWWKEGNVLFNDTLNTFYLRLYGMMEGRKCFIQRYSQHILFTVI